MAGSNRNVNRMVVSPVTSSSFIVEEWVDIPETVLRRIPELREWNDLMKERFIRTQTKMVDFVNAIQAGE